MFQKTTNKMSKKLDLVDLATWVTQNRNTPARLAAAAQLISRANMPTGHLSRFWSLERPNHTKAKGGTATERQAMGKKCPSCFLKVDKRNKSFKYPVCSYYGYKAGNCEPTCNGIRTALRYGQWQKDEEVIQKAQRLLNQKCKNQPKFTYTKTEIKKALAIIRAAQK